MNARQIVDTLLGDEDVEAIAKPHISTPYAHLLDAYLRGLEQTKWSRKAWETALGDGFMKRGHAAQIAAFNLDNAVQEIRNLKLNRNPKQVQAYMDHVIGASVEMLNLPPAKVEAVKMLFKRLTLE